MTRSTNRTTSLLATALVCGLVACSSSGPSFPDSDYPSMFGPPASATASRDKLLGLWGGAVESGSLKYDVRVRVGADSTTIAARCSFTDGTVLTVGATAASRITEKPSGEGSCLPIKGAPAKCGEITMLESKSDRSALGEKYCTIDLKPTSYGYSLAGLDLNIDGAGQELSLVKISD
jgi:hypothetical protein